MKKSLAALFLVVPFSAIYSQVAWAHELELTQIALSGDSFSLGAETRTFSTFREPVVNSRGDIVVGSYSTGLGGSAIVRLAPDGLSTTVAYRGQSVAALNGLEIDRFADLLLASSSSFIYSVNSFGDVAFAVVYEDSTQPGQRLRQAALISRQDSPSELHLIANHGPIDQSRIDSPELTYIHDVALSDSGDVALLGNVIPTTLLPFYSNGLIIAREAISGYGVSLGGLASDVFDDPFERNWIPRFERLTINSTGRAIVQGEVVSPSLSFSNVGVIGFDAESSPSADGIALYGDAIEGLGEGGVIFQSWFPTQNNRGDVVALATAYDAEEDRNRQGIALYREVPFSGLTSIEYLLEAGTPLEYQGHIATIDEISIFDARILVLNGEGRFAVTAEVDFGDDSDGLGGIRSALIGPSRDGSATPPVIAVSGATLPGIPDFRLNSIRGSVSINTAGDMAFTAFVSPVAGGPSALGLFLYSSELDLLSLVAIEGEEIEVAPGDIRVIQNLLVAEGSGGEDGLASSLDDSGKLVYALLFRTSSTLPSTTGAVYSARVLPVPEPAAITCCAVGFLALLAIRARSNRNSM